MLAIQSDAVAAADAFGAPEAIAKFDPRRGKSGAFWRTHGGDAGFISGLEHRRRLAARPTARQLAWEALARVARAPAAWARLIRADAIPFGPTRGLSERGDFDAVLLCCFDFGIDRAVSVVRKLGCGREKSDVDEAYQRERFWFHGWSFTYELIES